MKNKFVKIKPKEVTYRDYKNFDDNMFKIDLRTELNDNDQSVRRYEIFENIFLRVLDKHAPMKKKLIRGNHAPYMNTALRKAIMRRTQLQNKFYKTKKLIDLRTFKKQRNFVSRKYKKQRKYFYNNIDLTNFTDNKKFWKNVNPLFSDKTKTQNKITLVEDSNIITEDGKLADVFNTFFKDAVENLQIEQNIGNVQSTEGIDDPIDAAIHKFKNHPSILKIGEIVGDKLTANEFCFENINIEDIDK